MQQQHVPSTTTQSRVPATQKLPYARPAATFVPNNQAYRANRCGRKSSSSIIRVCKA